MKTKHFAVLYGLALVGCLAVLASACFLYVLTPDVVNVVPGLDYKLSPEELHFLKTAVQMNFVVAVGPLAAAVVLLLVLGAALLVKLPLSFENAGEYRGAN